MVLFAFLNGNWYKIVVSVLALLFLYGCGKPREGNMEGYVDAQLAYISSSRGGKLMELKKSRGDEVRIGEILFNLEEEPEKSALEEGIKRAEESKSRLENALKGQRPTEIEALESKIIQAEARNDLAKVMYERQKRLVAEKAVDQASVDQAKREMDESEGLLKELRANVETARLGARVDEINAARAQLAQAEAEVERLKWEYGKKSVEAMTNGRVFDTYFEVGENVGPDKAVLSLLIPEKVKGIFFIPERQLSQLRIGEKVRVICDGCKEEIVATIRFISPQAEYTPPVIYSKDRRSELVFRVETRFELEDAKRMNLGLPIRVELLEK